MPNKLYVAFKDKARSSHQSKRCFQSHDEYVDVSNTLLTARVYADGRIEIGTNERNVVSVEINGKEMK